jgi:hypothetical protein
MSPEGEEDDNGVWRVREGKSGGRRASTFQLEKREKRGEGGGVRSPGSRWGKERGT